MNDLRSQNRTLAPVRPLGPRTGEIVSTPPRARPNGNPLFQDSRFASEAERSQQRGERRQASGRRTASPAAADGRRSPTGEAADPVVAGNGLEPTEGPASPLTSRVSQELRTMPVSSRANAERTSLDADGAEIDLRDTPGGSARKPAKGPSSRPTKRRDVMTEEAEETGERFPWHFSFAANNDEPQELQAKTPLLARAFRSSVG